MKKSFLVFSVGLLMACQNNPYDGMGNVHDPKAPVTEKPIVPPVYKIMVQDSLVAEEGTEVVQKFTVQDEAHPQGHLGVYLRNFPDGTILKEISNSEFEIHFLPDASFVKGQNTRVVQGQIHIENADAKILDQNVLWTVKNKALEPAIRGITSLTVTAGSTFNFSARAIDLNGESFPHFKLVSPSMDNLATDETLMSSDPQYELPATEFKMTWKDVDAADVGKTVSFKLQACEATYQKCTNYEIQITVIAATP